MAKITWTYTYNPNQPQWKINLGAFIVGMTKLFWIPFGILGAFAIMDEVPKDGVDLKELLIVTIAILTYVFVLWGHLRLGRWLSKGSRKKTRTSSNQQIPIEKQEGTPEI